MEVEEETGLGEDSLLTHNADPLRHNGGHVLRRQCRVEDKAKPGVASRGPEPGSDGKAGPQNNWDGSHRIWQLTG